MIIAETAKLSSPEPRGATPQTHATTCPTAPVLTTAPTDNVCATLVLATAPRPILVLLFLLAAQQTTTVEPAPASRLEPHGVPLPKLATPCPPLVPTVTTARPVLACALLATPGALLKMPASPFLTVAPPTTTAASV